MAKRGVLDVVATMTILGAAVAYWTYTRGKSAGVAEMQAIYQPTANQGGIIPPVQYPWS
jgi:hypothetical protein